ncbi:NADH:flavin oxidoreductase/NADH oxidase family protein [Modicisalibacter radicis]|uniref:NADH:flavin oxidoreductase/NADH oxidase family protein n=1 Tax=Halomonas sp. EAR18 TaxID=2518972 RepID=UPI00109CE324|nr:NADH:flavin oxidoreductase/NADH oxidase family protein [Halomonas sp. EAR18]
MLGQKGQRKPIKRKLFLRHTKSGNRHSVLFEPLLLPCGIVLRNRLVKAAMSDSLGDGTGHPTQAQIRLYQRWAEGGVALAIVGEVQGSGKYAEKPGNLVLDDNADLERFRALARAGATQGAQLWLQLGHAGALAYPPTSAPKGPSALNLPGLICAELSRDEIATLPFEFARTARLARDAGFDGVELHAAHGFLISQFLSPLFNRRTDDYGGSIAGRMRLLLEVVEAVRAAVGPDFPVGLKLNSSDQLEGGLDAEGALSVIAALDETELDLIDISGGTYFPGTRSASDRGGKGPYFVDFTKRARAVTTKPLMATGGFKTLSQAEEAVASGAIDLVGMARALALEPSLPKLWQARQMAEPAFPRFTEAPEGGMTAWYTMRLTEIGEDRDLAATGDLADAFATYEARDKERAEIWLRRFSGT